jgi:PKD repeat protein
MPRTTGLAAILEEPVFRDCQTTGCLPIHEFVGGNTWVPQLLQDTENWRLPSPHVDELNDTIVSARNMLQKAASMMMTVETSGTVKVATVRVTNETGHKLPTGYPEGRRMWLNLKAYDASNSLIYESGVYTTASGVLDYQNPTTKVYETKLGITPELATLLDRPDIPASGGESFHFVLNNTILKDNRIPPRGYTVAGFDQPGLRPVGTAYADGQYWDDTSYTLPLETERVVATLYYQTSSKEYIDFLRVKGGADGGVLGTMWDDLKSPPEWMAQAAYPPAVQEASFSYLPLTPFEDEPVTFSAEISPTDAATPVTHTWQFGDGSPISVTTTPTISHLFEAAGSYTVWLTATNITGSDSVSQPVEVVAPVLDTAFSYQPLVPQGSQSIVFSAVVSPANATGPVTYTWQFGDGSLLAQTTASTISHSYGAAGQYQVVLTTSNAYGQASYSQTVEVVEPIIKTSFSHQPVIAVENELITFTAAVTPADATEPVTYSWQFGDGSAVTTTAASTTTHTYGGFGSYTVALTAANAYGQASYSATVTVASAAQAVEGTSFTYQPVEPIVSQPVTFTAIYTPGYATPPVTYSWQFEGGGMSVDTLSATITHTYAATGTYVVMLTTSNPYGQSVHTQTVTIASGSTVEPDERIYLPMVVKSN